MRVKIYMTDGTCHDISDCEEVYSPSTNTTYIRVVTKDCRYMFNMSCVQYLECFEEEGDTNE